MQPSRTLSEDLTSTHESLMRAVIPGTNQLQALAQVPPDAGSVTARVSPPTPAHILEEFGDGVAAASLIDALAPLWRRLLHLGLRLLGKRLWVTRACSSTQGHEFFSWVWVFRWVGYGRCRGFWVGGYRLGLPEATVLEGRGV